MHHERLKLAIEIIRTIPDTQLHLLLWQEKNPPVVSSDEVACSTICCAAGWLALDGKMQEQGLSVSSFSGGPVFNYVFGYRALGEFFGISEQDASGLFCPRQEWETEQYSYLSDKEIWLQRVERYTANPATFFSSMTRSGGRNEP